MQNSVDLEHKRRTETSCYVSAFATTLYAKILTDFVLFHVGCGLRSVQQRSLHHLPHTYTHTHTHTHTHTQTHTHTHTKRLCAEGVRIRNLSFLLSPPLN